MADRSSGADIEATGMQWADKGTLAENSVSERTASVRALCLSRKYRTVAISKDRDRLPQRLNEPSLSQRDGIDASKIGSDCLTRLAHECPPAEILAMVTE